jgi:organic hydroperoxide reductase OsmC/OhrA
MNDSTKHNYEVNLKWDSERRGTISSPVLPNKIEVATPPEFPKGAKDIWTPEHLFVASVNACLLATFLAIAENSRLEFVSFDCNAVGILEKIDGKLIISEIKLTPKVVISDIKHEEQLKKILEMSEKACAVSNSITSKITLEPIISLV